MDVQKKEQLVSCLVNINRYNRPRSDYMARDYGLERVIDMLLCTQTRIQAHRKCETVSLCCRKRQSL